MPSSARLSSGLLLDGRRALVDEEQRALIVADLHWGYAASHHARGNLLPAFGDEVLAQTLDALLNEYRPARLVWLGDSLHTLDGRDAAERWIDTLPRRHPGLELVILAGNHDRAWTRAQTGVLQLGNLCLHHGDEPLDVPGGTLELLGHWHPAVSLHDGAGTWLKVPALVEGPARLILPALSPWAAGVTWNQRLLPNERLWTVTPKRVFSLPRAAY